MQRSRLKRLPWRTQRLTQGPTNDREYFAKRRMRPLPQAHDAHAGRANNPPTGKIGSHSVGKKEHRDVSSPTLPASLLPRTRGPGREHQSPIPSIRPTTTTQHGQHPHPAILLTSASNGQTKKGSVCLSLSLCVKQAPRCQDLVRMMCCGENWLDAAYMCTVGRVL